MQDDVINAAYKVVSAFPEQVKQVAEMKQIALSSEERQVFAESAQNLIWGEGIVQMNKEVGNDLAARLLRPRRYSDNKSDLWSTFNHIQENAIKGGIRIVSENEQGRRSMRNTRAVGAIDRDAKLNKELMALAQKMSQLKTGALSA
jgi:hypothetical protein